jgi:hypothetical protein
MKALMILGLLVLSACGDSRNGTAVATDIFAEYQQCCRDHGVNPSDDHLVVKGHPTVQDKCWEQVSQ